MALIANVASYALAMAVRACAGRSASRIFSLLETAARASRPRPRRSIVLGSGVLVTGALVVTRAES